MCFGLFNLLSDYLLQKLDISTIYPFKQTVSTIYKLILANIR